MINFGIFIFGNFESIKTAQVSYLLVMIILFNNSLQNRECLKKIYRHGVVVITIAQLHSTKPELRFCAGSNPAHGVSEIRDGEDL